MDFTAVVVASFWFIFGSLLFFCWDFPFAIAGQFVYQCPSYSPQPRCIMLKIVTCRARPYSAFCVMTSFFGHAPAFSTGPVQCATFYCSPWPCDYFAHVYSELSKTSRACKPPPFAKGRFSSEKERKNVGLAQTSFRKNKTNIEMNYIFLFSGRSRQYGWPNYFETVNNRPPRGRVINSPGDALMAPGRINSRRRGGRIIAPPQTCSKSNGRTLAPSSGSQLCNLEQTSVVLAFGTSSENPPDSQVKTLIRFNGDK